MRRSLPTLSGLLLAAGLAGQTVFIPDVQFRDALNASYPDLVDASGYMLTADASNVVYLDLIVDWTPCDLTGIEAFAEMTELQITFTLPAQVIWTDMPPNIWRLLLRDYPGTELPPAGDLLVEFALDHGPNLTSVPTLPEGAYFLSLDSVPGLTSAPVLPSTLYELYTSYYPATVPWPTLTTGTTVTLRHTQHTVLPTPTENIIQLTVEDMPQLTGTLAPLAPDVFLVQLEGTGLQSINIPTSDATFILVRNNPNLGSLICGNGVQELVVTDELMLHTVVFQEGLQRSQLTNIPALASLTGSSSVMTNLTLESLPALMELPPLPEGLGDLVVNDVPISLLPELPAGLYALTVTSTQVTCLPELPAGLESINVSGSPITCMPNHPLGVPQILPLCTILNTFCPEYSPYVAGVVYRDDNVNGARDPGEPAIANAVVRSDQGGYLTGTDSEGRYSMGLPIGTHTLTVETGIPYVLSTTPLEHTITATTMTDAFIGRDFALEVDTVVPDLQVTFGMGPAVPGFYPHVWVPVRNTGTTVQNVQVRLTYDPALTYMSSSFPPTETVPDLVWDLDSLAIGGDTVLEVLFQLDEMTPIGTVLSGIAEIRPLEEDVDPTNNSMAYSEVVVGSYDPNDKQVVPSMLLPQTVAEGTRVDYRIRFQNTGTYPAQRVLVTDTLSSDLQLETFRFEMASHPCMWFIRDGAVHFVFNDIMLPDSASDEPNSHGLVRFSIMPSTELLNGEQVDNEANIYFDFNAPVITDTATFHIDLTTATHTIHTRTVSTYPVPTTGVLTVRHDAELSGGTGLVIDAAGRVVLQVPLHGDQTTLDLAPLPSGPYVLRLVKGDRVERTSVVKQ